MKKSKISIVLLIPLFLLFIYSISIPVFADTAADKKAEEEKKAAEEKRKAAEALQKAKEKCSNYITKDAPLLAQAYGMTIDYDMSNNHYFIISLNKHLASGINQKAVYNKIKFRIEKISVIDIDSQFREVSSQTFTVGTDEFRTVFGNLGDIVLTDRNSIIFNRIDNNVHRYRVSLKTSDGYVDPDYSTNCKSVSSNPLVSHIDLDYDYFGEDYHTTEKIETPPLPSPGSTGRIDCTNSYKENSFEQAFCNDIDAAKKAGVSQLTFTTANSTYEKLARSKSWDTAVNYHCDPFKSLVDANTSLSEQYKYTNTNYLWGIIDYTIPAGQYLYNKGGQHSDPTKDNFGQSVDPSMVEHENVTCTVQCEEIVTVEYGPPVAAKAGFCFAYRIKVTSRVNCSIKEPPQLPRLINTYCTPSPGCNHGNGYVDPAAGPNEDFEACVNECDKGKYSKKCSVDCYNKVYKGINIRNNMSYNLYDTINASTLGFHGNNTQDRTDLGNICPTDDNGQYTYGTYYYSPTKKAILWSPSSTIGRWYCENHYSGHSCVKTEGEGGGISSVCGCSAICRWNGCKNNATKKVEVYLNPGEAKRDYDKNLITYRSILAECEAYSKCSTTQAEFSIEVDYAYIGGKQPVTVHFPYTSNNAADVKDTIQYYPEHKSVACTSNNAYTTILGSNGCYTCAEDGASENDSTDSSNRWYQTEWGFPTTWVESKTGEISFVPPPSTGWMKREKQFCIPLNTQDVNQKWWNLYYINNFANDTKYSYSQDSSTDCHLKGCQPGEVSFTKEDEEKLTYNIRGAAKKFGLLEWNVNISCFYAANRNFPNTPEGPTCTFDSVECPDSKTGTETMRIRSVDLDNLFPAEDGTRLSSPDSTGRTPGFNWSAYATNILKDSNYTSRPSFYLTWVQSHGNSIYDSEYLDYEINLSKDDIRQLKKEDRNFTQFNGTILDNSVSTYKSDLFRGSHAILTNVNVPTEKALLCNNIKNFRSSECEDFQR